MFGSARLVFFALLALALFVPRAAWATHMAAHDQVSVSATHDHNHDDQGHNHASSSDDADAKGPDGSQDSDDAGGLVHDHAPAASLTAFVLPAIGHEDPGLARLGIRHDALAARFLLTDHKTMQERPPRTV